MKTKLIIIIIAIAALVGIGAILVHNKNANIEKSKQSEVMKTAPVAVSKVKKEAENTVLSLVGVLAPDKETIVASEAQGKILELKADVGDRIAKGALIAKVDDELKQASLISAQATYEKSKSDYDRYEKLWKEKSATDAQYEQAKLAYKTSEAALITAKRQLADTRIVAPFSGVVSEKKVDLGSMVVNNTAILTLVDISTLKVKVNASEVDAFRMKVGQAVELETEVYKGTRFNGKIKSIAPKADEAKTFQIEVSIANNSSKPLKAGLFGRVYFNSTLKEGCLTIPRAALFGSIKDAQVYVVENGVARLRKITIGDDFGDRLEVIGGLKENDDVVVSGQINIKDGDQVTINSNSN